MTDLSVLRLNTVFKLRLLNLDANKIDKICDRTMRANTKGVKKIIHTYIKQNTERKSYIYFYDNFVKKSSRRFLKKLTTEQIKQMVSTELDSLLRHDFKRNKNNVRFQKIVNKAIDSTQQCVDERVQKDIPMWIKQNYKLVTKNEKGVESVELVDDFEAEFNKKLVEAMIDTSKIAQDIFELVNELDYYQRCKKELVLNTPITKVPTSGIIDAFDLADYYKAKFHGTVDWQGQLDKCKHRIDVLLNDSEMPIDIKMEVRENQYEVKTKKNRLFIMKLRKQFEQFIVYEKYGDIQDTFFKNKQGSMKLVRQPSLILDYMEENPSVELDAFMFNCMTMRKKRFPKFYKKLLNNQHIKIIKSGKWRTTIKPNGTKVEYMYIIYDYLAPKEWFTHVKRKHTDGKIYYIPFDEWICEVLERFDKERFMTSEEMVSVSYTFPYHSTSLYNQVQARFTTNFRIFCNKVHLNGLSERIHDTWTNAEGDRETSKAIINPYQIYYPVYSKIDKRQYVSREIKKKQYIGLYGSFYHEVKYSKKGKLKAGGNIIKECLYETGDTDMDFFISDIDARSQTLEKYIMSDGNERSEHIGLFLMDVMRYYKESFEVKRLYKFLTRNKKLQIKNLGREMEKYRKYYDMIKQRRGVHGNSKEAKSLNDKIIKFQLPKEKVEQIRDSIKMYKGLKRELEQGKLHKYYNEFRNIIADLIDKYCEASYYRVVSVERNKISLARVMANNVHIKGVVRTYKTKNDGFVHKFLHEYRDDEIQLKNGVVKTREILSVLLTMSVALKDKSIFDDIYELLTNLNLETQEVKLLSEFKSY